MTFPIEIDGIKFVQAEDQKDIVRCMPEDVHKSFLHVPKDRHLPVLEVSAENIDIAKAKYMQAVMDGIIQVVDDPNLTPPGAPRRSQG